MKRLFLKAHTLSELLVVISLIGIISVITLNSIRSRNTQYNKLYFAAYDTLVQTVGNAFLQWTPEENVCRIQRPDGTWRDIEEDDLTTGGVVIGTYWSRDCWDTYIRVGYESLPSVGGINNFPRQYPGFLYGEYDVGTIDGAGTDMAFCRKLTAQINTIDEKNECQSFISGINPAINLNNASKFSETFCALKQKLDSKGKLTDKEECSGSKNIYPSFIAANGQKFYISSVVSANPPWLEGGNARERMMFRFIAVDLNGDSGPNTQIVQQKNKPVFPDIVLFAITNNGAVIPLGLPEYDQTYLSTVVSYPEFLNQRDPANPTQYLRNSVRNSEPMTFFDAKMHAWAGRAEGGGEFNYFGQKIILNEPLSYSNLLYFWGINCAPAGCNNRVIAERPGGTTNADRLLANLVRQFILNQNNTHFIRTEAATGVLDTDRGCIFGTNRCKLEFSP